MKSITSLAVLIAQLVLTSSAAAESKLLPALQCRSAQVVTPETGLVITCKILAETGGFYLLTDVLELEGPRKSARRYIYLLTSGNRHENLLQYHHASAGTLDFPVLFKPTMHLPLKSLAQLVEIAPRQTRKITVKWQLNGADDPDGGDWLALVKLIYLPKNRAAFLLEEGRLTPVCRAILAKGLAQSESPAEIVLKTTRGYPGRGPSYDGCRNVISMEFNHVYSNTMKFTIAPTPEGLRLRSGEPASPPASDRRRQRPHHADQPGDQSPERSGHL
jgi:hypothetical protein